MSEHRANSRVCAGAFTLASPSATLLLLQMFVGLTPHHLDSYSDGLSNIPSPHSAPGCDILHGIFQCLKVSDFFADLLAM